ncbi:hypothetical protein [Micromonospora sp. NPDC005413]|uniref:hypothetical protein n=1 Tax=Micromonospora sp. NPDC005413 TaxID=3154563 RepID=UPI0033A1127E
MRRRITMLLALPLLLALPAACTTASASPAPPQPPPPSNTPDPGQSYWPGQEDVSDAATTVEDASAPRWPDAYAGVSVDLPARTLLVHRIPTPGLDAAVRAMVPAVTVRFVDAKHSARTLDTWVEQVRADESSWRRRGITLYGTSTTIGECVDIEVEHPQRDAAKFTARYPRMTLCVQQGYPAVPLTAN